MSASKPATPELPDSAETLAVWIRDRVPMPDSRRTELLKAVGAVLESQRQRWEASKDEAITALSEAFAQKMARLHAELVAKEATVSSVSRYFEELVAELTEKSHRDPKTKLMNFDWFMERLETFLAVEQRGRWCALGVVDIRSFKWFNDNLGHAVGDQIIERVAQILLVQIRSMDMLAKEHRAAHDLHARFGGDEFCFLIPDLPGSEEGVLIAERFKQAVESFDWSLEHPALAARPVRVDVGVVCMRLGPVESRRSVAKALPSQLMQWADRLMYGAKDTGASHVHPVVVELQQGLLVEMGTSAAASLRKANG